MQARKNVCQSVYMGCLSSLQNLTVVKVNMKHTRDNTILMDFVM